MRAYTEAVLRTISLGLVLAVTGAPAPAHAQEGACTTALPAAAGDLTVSALKAQRDDGSWEDVLGRGDGMCLLLSSQSSTAPDGTTSRNVSFSLAVNGRQDLTAARPASTRYTIAFRGTPEHPPLSARGAFGPPRMAVADDVLVLQATATPVTFGQGSCEGGGDRIGAFLGGTVALDGPEQTATAQAQRDARGQVTATDASTLAEPRVGVPLGPDGTPASFANHLLFDVTGCGDGDPATLDGFLSGVVPRAVLARLGVDGDSAADPAQLAVTDNGGSARNATVAVARRADVHPAPVPGVVAASADPEAVVGVRLEARLSYSRHQVALGPRGAGGAPTTAGAPPVFRVRLLSLPSRRTLTRTGRLVARVRCSGPCVVRAVLRVGGIARKPVGLYSDGAGRVTVRAKLTRRERRALRRGARISITAQDAFGRRASTAASVR